MSARKPKVNLTKIFDAFARKAVHDFPELKGKFSIYSLLTDTLHGSFKNGDKKAILKLQRKEAQKDSQDPEGPPAFSWAEKGYHLIDYLENNFDERSYTTTDDPYGREVSSLMEHELGHLVAPGGHNGKHTFSECVAEAFSFIRPQQVHKAIGGQITVASYLQSNLLILKSDISHFFVPVLHELQKLSETYHTADMKLTPIQSANLAYRLALLYAPSEKTVQKLQKIFQPIEQDFESADHWKRSTFEGCAKIMFEDHGKDSPLIFMAGQKFLEPILNKNMPVIKKTWKPRHFKRFNNFEGPPWDSLRRKIETRVRQEETETPEQRLAHEAKDMMVLGRFDKNPDKKINPHVYESQKNKARLKRAMDAYTAIRYFQETGKKLTGSRIKTADTAALGREQTIARACKIANEPAVQHSHPSAKGAF